MADGSIPGLGDVLGFLGGGMTKSFTQFQRGVSDFLKSIENFNKTLEQLHQVGVRVNGLLDAVEAPVQRVAPGLNQLAETLSHPLVANLPEQLGQFMDSISELVTRLRPLGQLAESAGGLFGLRNLAGRPATPPTPAPPPEARRSAMSGEPESKSGAAPRSASAARSGARQRPATGKQLTADSSRRAVPRQKQATRAGAASSGTRATRRGARTGS